MAKEDPWTAYAKARELFREGNAKQAIDVMRDHAEFTADRPNVARSVARFEIEDGDFATALALLDPLEDEDHKTAKLRIEAYAGLRDWDTIRKVAEDLPDDAYRDDPKMCFAIAKAAAMDIDSDTAIKAARMGLQSKPNHSQMLKILYGMISAQTLPSDLMKVIEAEAFEEGKGPEQIIGLEVALRHGGLHMDDFTVLFHKAKNRWPDAPELALCEAWLVPESGEKPEGADQLEKLRGQLRHEAKINSHIAAAAATFDSFDKSKLTRDLIVEGQNRGMLVSDMGSQDHIILNFCGLGRQGGRDEMFDAYYSSAGAGSIFLRDTDQLMFLNGIGTVGDGFEATANRLKEEINNLSPSARITAVGPSGGGFGALAFGAMVGAERIVCFSSATVVEKSRVDEIGDHRARAVMARINKFVPRERLDMGSYLASLNYSGQIDAIYGADNDVDRQHAENLLGLPNVSLYPVRGFAQHSTILHAVACDALSEIILGDMGAVDKMHIG